MGGTIASAGCCCSSSAAPPPPAQGAAGAPTAPSADTAAPTATGSSNGPLTGPAAALEGKGEVKAIDVSNWQGNIDWKQVQGAGVGVAYLKASEGAGFEDKSYVRNREQANANGIVIGAYDFAKPSTAGGVEAAAKQEAEHFLATAKVKKGDLAPVLDLEDAGGLSKGDLAKWTSTWADTVSAATGVKPTVYTSPSFWTSHVGDNATAAKFNLWVANWGVNSPTVPAGFDGWKGWQYTSDGSTPGISGRVDQDKVKDPASLVIR